jgi:Na+/proline symporter
MSAIHNVSLTTPASPSTLVESLRIALLGVIVIGALWGLLALDWLSSPWDYVVLFLAYFGAPVGVALATTVSLLRHPPSLDSLSPQSRAFRLAQCVLSLVLAYGVGWCGWALMATAFGHRETWLWN